MRWNGPLEKVDDFRYKIPSSYKGEHHNLRMKTSAIIYADEKMIQSVISDNAPEQTANMTILPGIIGNAMAMPDIHWGYGFPIGGVAATDSENGVISPGGVGFDINCGVRLVRTDLHISDLDKNCSASVFERAMPCFVMTTVTVSLSCSACLSFRYSLPLELLVKFVSSGSNK